MAPGEAWVDSRKMLGIRALFGDLNAQASQPLWARKDYAVNEQNSFRQKLFAVLKQGPPDGLGFRPVTTNSRKNGAPEAAFKIAPKKWSVVLHSLQGRSAGTCRRLLLKDAWKASRRSTNVSERNYAEIVDDCRREAI